MGAPPQTAAVLLRATRWSVCAAVRQKDACSIADSRSASSIAPFGYRFAVWPSHILCFGCPAARAMWYFACTIYNLRKTWMHSGGAIVMR
jgi:hypothetical protein